MSRVERIEAALLELAALKDLKDKIERGDANFGDGEEYGLRKPLAWAEARAALALPEEPEPARAPMLKNGEFALALNVTHPKCHEAADAFWAYWKSHGETHKHGYFESTWGAINRALRLVGVCVHFYGEDQPLPAAQSAPVASPRDDYEGGDSFADYGAAPRAPVLLTEKQIGNLASLWIGSGPVGGLFVFARAIEQKSLALNGSAPGAESASAPVAAAEAPEQWSGIVEDRLNSWRRRIMNKSGDRLALDDFMDQDSIDDLIDFVCAPIATPASAEARDAAPTFDFEILVNDECLASGSCGTREDMEREATHYAAQYESEGEVEIKRYVRYELAAPDAEPIEEQRSRT